MSKMKILTINGKQYTVADPDLPGAEQRLEGQVQSVDKRLDSLTQATAIVRSALGETVAVADAAKYPVQGLTLYGKTTQAGTPSPDAPADMVNAGSSGTIKVTVAGKNLLKPNVGSQTQNGVTVSVSADGKITVDGTSTKNTWFLAGYIKATGKLVFVPNWGQSRGATYFTFTPDGKTEFGYDANVTFTKEEDGSVGVGIVIESKTYSNFTAQPMVRIAHISDTYDTYKEPQTLIAQTPNGLPGIPVSSGGNHTDESGQDWICDEVDFARGVYVQRIAQADMGTREWQAWSSKVYATDKLNGAKPAPSNIDKANAMCSGFVNQSFHDAVTAQKETGFAITTDATIAVHTGTEMTLAAFKEMMHGMMLLYELAEPVETPLSAEELAAYAALHSNKPNTTVFNDAGAYMELSYVADTKTYIDNQFAQLAAAIVNNT